MIKMSRMEITRTLSKSPIWAYMSHEEKREAIEEAMEVVYSLPALSVTEAIRYGSIADYL